MKEKGVTDLDWEVVFLERDLVEEERVALKVKKEMTMRLTW